ncbi:MAG: CehA/McbA family metallohydrolase [bacterium]|nr:CehA/McbA family metallohydrolase [bacterium]
MNVTRRLEGVELNGRADLHMHTTVSDGIASVQTMLAHIADRGQLDVIAITDHDRLEASLWAYANRERYPFEIVPGLEVTTCEGHVLALWCTQPIPKGLSLKETCAAIHEQDGIAVIAHPYEPTIDPVAAWRYFRHPEVLLEAGIDAVEVFNAGAFTLGCNWLAARQFRDTAMPLLGNSDAHMPASVGTGRTRFHGKTAADLRTSIANGWTAAEGKSWSLTVYLKLSLIMIPKKLNGSLATNAQSTRPTLP